MALDSFLNTAGNLTNSTTGDATSVLDGTDVVLSRNTYETVIAILFLLVIIVAALLGNLAVIAVCLLRRSMRKEISNLLIVNLSITDLSNTLLVMMSSMMALVSDKWFLGDVWCNIVCSTNYCLIIVSMLTLCCISLDRYKAVMQPLSYPLHITRCRMKMTIAYTWVQGIAFGIAPSICGWVAFDYWEAICAIQWHLYRPDTILYVVLAFLLCFLIPGIVLIYCYSKIVKEVKNQKSLANCNVSGDSRTQERNKRKVSDRSKLVWSLLVVVAAYFLCTTPFSVTKLIKVIAVERDSIPGSINLVATLLGYVASAINPFIYGIFRRDFRNAYKHLFYSIIGKRQNDQSAFSSDNIIQSQSGVGTITQANNLTLNHEADNTTESLQSVVAELQMSTDMLKNGNATSTLVKDTPLVGLNSVDKESDTHFCNLKQCSTVGVGQCLDVLEEHSPKSRANTGSITSCRHVIVKSVFDSLDDENENIFE